MIAALLSAIFSNLAGPLSLWLLKRWIENEGIKADQLKSYYAFLEEIDKQTKIDVTLYVAASDARQATIDRIKKAREQSGNTGS